MHWIEVENKTIYKTKSTEMVFHWILFEHICCSKMRYKWWLFNLFKRIQKNATKKKKKINQMLTLFLHVTCTRYFVSGNSDSSTSGESVNRLPIKPPPETSHVTKHWLGTFFFIDDDDDNDELHVMSADVNDPSRIIEIIFNFITSNWDLFSLTFDDDVWDDGDEHDFQHCEK